jgi:hypothetical protein
MNNNTILCTGLLVLGLLCLSGIAAAQQDASGTNTSGTVLVDDIAPYNGPIAADSPLYGLKLALENMDESFTANETERVGKEMDHAQLRLSEVRRALELNESESAQHALDNYWIKMDLANVTLSRWSSNATGLLHAQEQIVKHQLVLENLLASNPNNTGLQRAYNNSLALEDKFAEKTAIQFQRISDKNNQTTLKVIRLEQKEYYDRKGGWDANTTVTTAQTDDRQKGSDKGKNAGNGNPVTNVTTQVQSGPQQQGQGHQQDNNGNGNSGNKGNGNSRNK